MKEINSRPILRRIIPAKISLHVLFALMLAFIIPVRTVAQDYYPVHATVQVLPPYSLYLSDYSNGFRDRLVITLYNRDLQQQTLDCRLRLRISNTSGFCIESRDEVPQRSITVEPNVPLRLTSQDIAPYLQTGNVKQTGTLRNGRLPEGMMTFSVQVVEQHTGRILSPWASGRAWLETKKPPMLVMPEKDETVAFADPQHILFRWYPQHQGLSGVEYELHIRELPDYCQNPAAQYDSGKEVFTTKTRQTLYNYSNIDPELIPGHTYAWRVRAVAMDGIDEVGVFDNDGYSETGWFRLVRGCDAPVIDRAEAGYRKLDLGWHGSADDMRYTVQYSAEKENGSYNWKDTTTIDNETTLYGLTPGATYSYRVGALCPATGKPVYSQIGTVKIPNRDSISAANCGVAPVYKELSKERKTDLKVGDRVTVGGDYTMLITELNNKGNGVYGGKGRLTFTWVFFVGLEVTFDDLVVNTDGYQIDGTVNTVYDGTNTNIANLDQLNDGGVTNRESRMSADGRSTVMDFSVPPMPRSDLSEDGGSVVVYDLSGAPHTIEIPSNGNGGQSIPFSLTDIDGNTWRFESCDSVVTDSLTGNQKTVHGIKMTKLDAVSGFSKDKLSDKVKARIAFANGGFYAFDDLRGKYYDRSSKLGKDYLDKSSLGDGTFAPWKLVPMGKTDKIKAGLNPTKIDIDIASVRFVDADGHDLESSYDSDNAVWTVNLTAAATEGDYYNVYAVAKPKDGKGSYQTIGKLFVVSYKTTKADIVLLPVEKHDCDISKLNAEISDIFAPCGVEVNITESDALVGNAEWDLNGDQKLSLTNDAETDNVKRSAEMKALEDIIKAMPEYKKDVLYLVYVPNGSKSSDADVEGNWGRGRQIGYVFGKKLEVRTIAHEVGHAFTLQHTFDRQYGGSETRGKTDNLMDYSEGTSIDAFQWEILAHNAPKIVASVVDGAEDNYYSPWTSYGKGCVIPNIPGDKEGACFLAPDGKIVSLSKNEHDLTFIGGMLSGFRIGNERYIAFHQGKKFCGYFKNWNVERDKDGTLYSVAKNVSDQASGMYKTDNHLVYSVYIVVPDSSTNAPCGSILIGVADGYNPISSDTIYRSYKKVRGLPEVRFTSSVINEENCLKGRAREFYKFIVETFAEELTEEEKHSLLKDLRVFNDVCINGIDSISTDCDTIKIEFNNLNKVLFKSILKRISTATERINRATVIVVDFDDVDKFRDIYEIYELIKDDKTFADCIKNIDVFKDLANSDNIFESIRKFARTAFDVKLHLNICFSVLNCALGSLEIPEYIWNANHKNYKTFEFLDVVLPKIMKYTPLANLTSGYVKHDFALLCGAWNSAIDVFKGVSEMGAWLTKNPEEMAKDIVDFFGAMSQDGAVKAMFDSAKNTIKEFHGFNEEGLDSYHAAYAVGYDAVFVASFFVGGGEVAAIVKAQGVGAKIATAAKIIAKIPGKCLKDVVAVKNVVLGVSKLPSKLGKAVSKTIHDIRLSKSIKECRKLYLESDDIKKIFDQQYKEWKESVGERIKKGETDGLEKEIDETNEIFSRIIRGEASFVEKYTPSFCRSIIEGLGEVNAYSKYIGKWLPKGMTKEEFGKIIAKRVDVMSDKEKKMVRKIRDKIPVKEITENTVMQKIISEQDFLKYLSGVYGYEVGGFMSRACDVTHLKSVEEICYGLALNYDNTPFFKGNDICVKNVYALKFKFEKPDLRIPYDEASDLTKFASPCTINGHTAGTEKYLGAPEFYAKRSKMKEAEIYRIDKNGNETLVAVLDITKEGEKILKKVISK